MRLTDEIRELQSDLAARQRQLEDLIASSNAGGEDEPLEDIDFEAPAARTIAARIVDILAKRSPMPLSVGDIATAIGESGSVPTVRAIISKLFHSEAIERIAAGQYRIARPGRRAGADHDD